MFNLKKNILVLATAGVVSFGSVAHAAPNLISNWGVHNDPSELAGQLLLGGSGAFDHVYNFSLGSSFDALAVAVSNDFGTFFDITGGTVQLFASNGDADYTNDASLGSFSFDSLATGQTFSGLSAGNYFYEVTGTVTGSGGGSYLLSSNISPIPEPETYAMLLVGLGLVGFSVRRRKTSI